MVVPLATDNSSFKSYQYPVGLTGMLNIALLQNQTAPVGAKKFNKSLNQHYPF